MLDATELALSTLILMDQGTAAMYKDDWIQSALDKSALYTLRAEET